jgi:hypothetical protein
VGLSGARGINFLVRKSLGFTSQPWLQKSLRNQLKFTSQPNITHLVQHTKWGVLIHLVNGVAWNLRLGTLDVVAAGKLAGVRTATGLYRPIGEV